MDVPDDLEVQLISRVETLAAAKGLAHQPITRETTFTALQMDSLDKINLTFDVEEAFGIEIPDASIGSINTVGDMIDGVRALIDARAA